MRDTYKYQLEIDHLLCLRHTSKIILQKLPHPFGALFNGSSTFPPSRVFSSSSFLLNYFSA